MDTIELLETIGQDASLRHASNEDLSQALSGLGASEEFKLAAMSGDSNHFAQELGGKDTKLPQSVLQTIPDDTDDESTSSDDALGHPDSNDEIG